MTDPPIVPPNTRVPSPHHEPDSTRLPYAEPIPGEYIGLAAPWIEVMKIFQHHELYNVIMWV